MIYGYARVSTDGQKVAAQVAALKAAGAGKVFREVASGAKTNRAQLRKAIATLEAGDVLMVASIGQQVMQHVSGNPKRHQRGQPCLQLVQLRPRPTVRWPTDTGFTTTAARAQKPRKPQSHLAEQRGDPVRLPILHMTCPATRPALWPNRRVGVGLLGDKLLLNVRQQQLRFGQRQTQVGYVAEIIRTADRHHLETPGLTINPHSNQTQRPFHP
jgi:hypothetical protein